MLAETATAAVPAPGNTEHGATCPSSAVGPHSNVQPLTATPLGLTVAFRTADVAVRFVADLVTTVGGGGAPKAPSPLGVPTPAGPSKPTAPSHCVVPKQSRSPYCSLTVGSPQGPGSTPSQYPLPFAVTS